MISLDDYQRLRREIDGMQQRRDKAAGVLEQMLRRLQTEYDCQGVAMAKEELGRMRKQTKKLRTIAETSLAEFCGKYPTFSR